MIGRTFGVHEHEPDFEIIPEGFRDHVTALREALIDGSPPVVALTPDLCCRGALMHNESADYVLVVFEPISRRDSKGRLDAFGLTRREHQVAELVLDGLGNRTIAARVGVSENTVESHIKRVLTKARAIARGIRLKNPRRFGLSRAATCDRRAALAPPRNVRSSGA